MVKDGVPLWWVVESSVQANGMTPMSNEDGFCRDLFPVVRTCMLE